MKNIIITGGAGFIGSHVVRLFVNKYPEYQLQHQVEITDIPLNESIVRLILDVLEVSQVACVCQLIEVDDVILRIFVHEKSYYV